MGEEEEKQGPAGRQRTTLDVEAWRLSRGAPPARERNEVAVEAPVVIDVQDVGTYSLVCTPADTRALAVGFAFTEGIIQGLDDIVLLSDCEEDPGLVRVQLADSRNVRAPERNLMVLTSCGICGSRQAVEAFLDAAPQVGDSLRLSPEILRGILEQMQGRQQLFARTGGTHAAAVFDAEGAIMAFAEDVGRHNALDKAIGTCLLADLSTAGCGVALSGRASFELVAKGARAGIEIAVAVSAPTSLAVEGAERSGMTLCGFVRGDRVTVYTHAHRIVLEPGTR